MKLTKVKALTSRKMCYAKRPYSLFTTHCSGLDPISNYCSEYEIDLKDTKTTNAYRCKQCMKERPGIIWMAVSK